MFLHIRPAFQHIPKPYPKIFLCELGRRHVVSNPPPHLLHIIFFCLLKFKSCSMPAGCAHTCQCFFSQPAVRSLFLFLFIATRVLQFQYGGHVAQIASACEEFGSATAASFSFPQLGRPVGNTCGQFQRKPHCRLAALSHAVRKIPAQRCADTRSWIGKSPAFRGVVPPPPDSGSTSSQSRPPASCSRFPAFGMFLKIHAVGPSDAFPADLGNGALGKGKQSS